MTDVAAVAKVSLKTVSRVINGVTSVDPQLATRVTQAAEQLGFRANFSASSLRSGASTATIGLITKDFSNEFYATIASAVADVARANQTQLITAHSGENAQDEMDVIFDLCSRRVDGLLIVPTGGDHSRLRREIDLGIPMVFVDRSPIGLVADSVVLDNFAGAYEATTKLISDGHHRIAVIVDTLNMPTMRERLEGIRAAYNAADLRLDEALIVAGVNSPKEASVEVDRLLAYRKPPTAFFCGNNRSATGVLQALWDQGRDEALVSFDDFQLSGLMPRPFTIVSYDTRAMGTMAAELLFRRIRREDFEPTTIVLPTHLRAGGVQSNRVPQ